MSILMGENTLVTHRISFELKMSFLYVQSKSDFFLDELAKTGILISYSLKILYISGIIGFDL